MSRPLQTGSLQACNQPSDDTSPRQSFREMGRGLRSRSHGHNVDSLGSATVQRSRAQEPERKQVWRTATYGTIIVCHSERSEESQFVIRANPVSYTHLTLP